MPKCNKVKNPCKICLGQVTMKNGLQCQGACKTWMHFDCLNYTPGKIRDIKAGVIRITCPCPDCKSSGQREFRAEDPYSCNNSYCPANQLPRCKNDACPINLYSPPEPAPTSDKVCALNKCGQSCKKNSTPHLEDSPLPPPLPPCKPIQTFSSDSRFSSSTHIPGDHGRSASSDISLNTLEQMCNTVGQLTNQLNCLLNKMKNGKEKTASGLGAREMRGTGCGTCGNMIGVAGCGKLDCSPRESKVNCPQPCRCPGNPRR